MKKITVLNDSNSIKCTFFSSLGNVDNASNMIKKFLADQEVKEHVFNILLCIREALINAVTHGNNGDKKKVVTIFLKLELNTLFIEVEDEGAGFDWELELEKTRPIKEESGRGMVIMKDIFGRIKYNLKGNRLYLEKKITI